MEKVLKNAETIMQILTQEVLSEENPITDYRLDLIKFSIKDHAGNLLKDMKFRMYDKTEFIPNIAAHISSNEKGEIIFKSMNINKKYLLELADIRYTNSTKFYF